MIQFGIENIRRVNMGKPVSFRPINIIVGRNSSGKSTFVRSLPLLRQSLLTRTNAPVLWYGDLVDFGSYKTAVFNHNIEESIFFTFGREDLEIDQRALRQTRYRPSTEQRVIKVDSFQARYEVGNRISSGGRHQTVLRSVEYSVSGANNINLKIRLSEDGSRIVECNQNGGNLSEFIENDKIRVPKSIFSTLGFAGLHSVQSGDFLNEEIPVTVPGLLFEKLQAGIDQRLKRSNIFAFLSRVSQSLPLDRDRVLVTAGQYSNRLKSHFEKIFNNENSEEYRALKSITDFSYISQLSNYVLLQIKPLFEQCTYIGPVRARSNRYYRHQELSVSDIDPDGTNLPMFLSSLSPRQIDSFSRFVNRTFGFGVQIENAEGHISLYLKYPHDRTNIVDSGFGVSQLLPVLAQLWWSSSGNRNPRTRQISAGRSTPLLVMEQPELHLHPAHQALLADVFVEAISSAPDGTQVHLVVETHSSEIINRLGTLIEAGQLKAGDVQVLLFDDDKNEIALGGIIAGDEGNRDGMSRDQVEPRVAKYDESGILLNWPSGFFIPAV